MDDLYLILGVDSDAKLEAIQERFRFLAQAYHPDKFSSPKHKQLAEEEFKKINNVYQILSNPRKRADYDLQRSRTTSYSRTDTNDVNRKAEETVRRQASEENKKKEEQLRKERANRERAEAKRRRPSTITSSEMVKAWRLIVHAASAIPNAENMGALLNSFKMIDIQGSTLMLGFASEVVKSKMTLEGKEFTRQIISEVLGITLDIQCIVTGSTK